MNLEFFTKFTRPFGVLMGILMIFCNYTLFPLLFQLFGKVYPIIALPTEFWVFLTTITGAYTIARTMDKRNDLSKGTQSQKPSSDAGAGTEPS